MCGWCRDRGSTAAAQLLAYRLLGGLDLALFRGLLPCVELHGNSTHVTHKAWGQGTDAISV